MAIRRCLACLRSLGPDDGTEEHVFPDAIGGSLTTRDMCKPCNDRWGAHVDAHLSNHTLVAIRRIDHGLKGKSGKIPNPFAVGTLVADPQQRVFTGIGEQPHLRRRQFFHDRVERLRRPDGSEQIRVSGDARRSVQLQAIVDRISERARRDGRPVTMNGTPVLHQSKDPEVHVALSVDLWRWKKALVKIAYECAYLVVGDALLDEPIAAEVRRRLEQEPSAQLFDGLNATFGGPGRLSDMPLPSSWHYACVASTGQHLICHARVFDLYEVRLTMDVSPDLVARAGSGTCFFVDARRGRCHTGGPDTFAPVELEIDLRVEAADQSKPTDEAAS